MSVLNHAAQQWATWFKSTESGQFPANTDIVESLVPLNDLEVEEHLSGGRGGVGVLLGGRCSGFHFPCGKAASLCGFLTGFVQGDALDGQQGNVHLVVAFCIHGSVHCSAHGSGSSSKDFPQDIFFLFWYISQTRREQRQAMKTLIGLPDSIPAASRCPVSRRGFEPDRRRFFFARFPRFSFQRSSSGVETQGQIQPKLDAVIGGSSFGSGSNWWSISIGGVGDSGDSGDSGGSGGSGGGNSDIGGSSASEGNSSIIGSGCGIGDSGRHSSSSIGSGSNGWRSNGSGGGVNVFTFCYN